MDKNTPAKRNNSFVPVAVVMISLNEGHNMEAVLENVHEWAEEIFLVDSYSSDDTVDIALRYGVHVVQRKFRGFGDQWNFAIQQLPIKSSWVMKMDPDERLTEKLKLEIERAIAEGHAHGLSIQRRLWFMGRPLPIRQRLLRVWRSGVCRFSDVLVNEHPQIEGKIRFVEGDLEHHDSPNLHHWYDKQNNYTTTEAQSVYQGKSMAAAPKLLGDSFQRRMWIKKNLFKIPFRYSMLFLYHYFYLGAWRAGRVGYIWAKLRVGVYQARDYKLTEMQIAGHATCYQNQKVGKPDNRVPQY